MQKKNSFAYAQNYRRAVQIGFLITIIWIGIEFTGFVGSLESAKMPSTPRPPGVEAFLPISALISLKYWILTGIINPIHPAGLLIFLMALGTALILKKGFCSWICPFGLLSEILSRVHYRLFIKGFNLHPWPDTVLRSLKYLILVFFLWAVLIQMDTSALEIFIYSPYNRVADIKMLKFFSEVSTFSLVVLISLFFLTILLRHFWCRYLCPYGALLGVLSLFSMTRIRRNKTTCIGCEKCTIACPSNIKVHRSGTVHSDECHACMKCIDICPVPNTISFSLREKGGIIRPWIYATLILIIFAGGSSLAKATGYWQNAVPIREYLFHVQHLHLPMYHHNRGSVPEYNPNLFSRPDRISKMRFQNGMEVYDETHRNPRKRASSNSSGA